MEEDCNSKFISAATTSTVCALKFQCLMYQIFIFQNFKQPNYQVMSYVSHTVCKQNTCS
jgi:hypothetical protein